MNVRSQVGEAAATQFAADQADASHIAAEWRELSEAAERRDCELEDVKGRFSETTRQQVGRLSWRFRPSHIALCVCLVAGAPFWACA